MPTTRQSIIRGPGAVTFGGATFHDVDGIPATVDVGSGPVTSSMIGTLDTIKTDQTATISFTPVAAVTDPVLAALFPAWLRTPEIGRSVYGATDAPLVVHSLAGTKVTFAAAAVSSCPELRLTPVQTAFGAVEFRAVVGNGLLPDAPGAFYSVESAPYGLGAPTPDNLTGVHYTGTWGELSIPDTVSGWTVRVQPQFEAVTTDSQGTADYTLAGVEVTARCRPFGLTEAQILAALNAGAGRGASLAGANNLVISGSNAAGALTVTLMNAALTAGPLEWGSARLRDGEIEFRANARSGDGALFTLAVSRPSAGGEGQ